MGYITSMGRIEPTTFDDNRYVESYKLNTIFPYSLGGPRRPPFGKSSAGTTTTGTTTTGTTTTGTTTTGTTTTGTTTTETNQKTARQLNEEMRKKKSKTKSTYQPKKTVGIPIITPRPGTRIGQTLPGGGVISKSYRVAIPTKTGVPKFTTGTRKENSIYQQLRERAAQRAAGTTGTTGTGTTGTTGTGTTGTTGTGTTNNVTGENYTQTGGGGSSVGTSGGGGGGSSVGTSGGGGGGEEVSSSYDDLTEMEAIPAKVPQEKTDYFKWLLIALGIYVGYKILLAPKSKKPSVSAGIPM